MQGTYGNSASMHPSNRNALPNPNLKQVCATTYVGIGVSPLTSLWGYGPRYPYDKTWVATSKVAQPTTSRRAP